MRAKYKRAVGLEGVDLQEAEEEFEEWLKETFAGVEGTEKSREGEGERDKERERNWRRKVKEWKNRRSDEER